MTRFDSDCARFAASLDAEARGMIVDAAEARFCAEHRAGCASCAEELEQARAVAGWDAPAPAPDFVQRTLRLIEAERALPEAQCGDVHDEIDALLAGELDKPEAGRLHAHVEHCAPCAHHLDVAEKVDALLAGWRAPLPPAGFAERAVASIERSRSVADAPRFGRATGGSRTRRSIAAAALAAAAVVALTVMLHRGARLPEPQRLPSEFDLAAQRIERQRDLMLRAVAYEQYPAAIGAFEPTLAHAGRARRPSGNALHKSLRRTLARNAPVGVADK